MTQDQERRLAYVLDNFDFDKVHRVMKFLKWEWARKGIPSIEMMKEKVRYLAERSARESARIATGGFYVEWADGDLEVHFAVVSESSHWLQITG